MERIATTGRVCAGILATLHRQRHPDRDSGQHATGIGDITHQAAGTRWFCECRVIEDSRAHREECHRGEHVRPMGGNPPLHRFGVELSIAEPHQ